MAEIWWHWRETSQQTEKTNFCLSSRRLFLLYWFLFRISRFILLYVLCFVIRICFVFRTSNFVFFI
uniref:Uncharacterized protein n=1 Tax=Kuenenia stuttgartiensis TaxID=174633 RepID=Q1Q3P8_KUEST|nr:unknown protein [Candidatus Kuenenia stuttgartiensis]